MSRRGNIVVVLMFTLLVAASGTALLLHTDTHMKIVAVRRERRLEAAALGQELLLRLHRFRETLAQADMNAYAAPEDDFFNATHFPAVAEKGMQSGHDFSRFVLRDAGAFRAIRILDLVRTRRRDGRLECSARAAVDLVSGDIPIGEFGLLVAQKGESTAATFLAGRGVDYGGAMLPQVGEFPLANGLRGMLSAALGLPVEVPDWRRIREAFGLEPSAAPLAPGVYLAREDEEVKAVFVEGDLQKLVFSAANGWQSIVFSQDDRCCELRYRPGEGALEWSGADGPAVAGMRFKEKVVVHGSVWSVEQGGTAAFLPAARLELLACGRLVVRSGLESEGLTLGQERFPCLLLMTTASDFFTGAGVKADVVFDVDGPAIVQAQVVSAGTLINGRAVIDLTGSLACGAIANEGIVRVGAAQGGFVLDDQAVVRGFKFLKNFRIHFIEEKNHEE